MRPQFHHVDAITHQETAARRSEAADENKRPSQALALAQTYKDNRDVENLEALRAKNLLQIAQEERWTRLSYYDEDVRSPVPSIKHLLIHIGTRSIRRISRQAVCL